MSEVEDEASYDVTSTSETAGTCGGYRGDDGNGGPIRSALVTRGSGSTPLYRNACVRENGGGWRSFASNKGRTRGPYGTCMGAAEIGTQRRPLSPDNRWGVRV